MKLYLSSYRLGNHAATLGQLVAGRKRVGVIRNALDFSQDRARLRAGQAREFAELRQLGLAPEALDLRKYFDAQADLRGLVQQCDALWVVGGNAFILRRAMRQSGLDTLLVERGQDETFVYAGYSAGICVLTPTLQGIHLVDDPTLIPTGYAAAIIWAGLGLVPFSFAPHYRSHHPDSALIEQVVAFFIERKMPFYPLCDGEVYMADWKPPPNEAQE